MPLSLAEKQAVLLPEQYQDPARAVAPTSMGSAGLKFAPDGRVAWDEIWGSFCDLAMAGGPPHRGTLLEPATPAELAADPGRARQAAEEIARGITLVTGLEAQPSRLPGWVRVECPDATPAGWLTRAITMENVAVRGEGSLLFLPAGPAYRLEKEIKNVITATAKTHHYWSDHISPSRRQAIAMLFAESPLIQPAPAHGARLASAIAQATTLIPTPSRYPGWLGLECQSIPTAISLMRAVVAANVLARREAHTLFVPLNATTDPGAEIVLAAVLSAIAAQIPAHPPAQC